MKAGDLLLVSSNEDWEAKVIHVGTQSVWNHVAIFMSEGGALLAEATRKGIAFADARKYANVTTHVIDTQLSGDQRIAACRFASSCVGQRYSTAQIASIMFAWASGKRWFLGRENEEDCASFAARTMEHGGIVLPRTPALFRPRDFADLFDVTPRLEKP